MKEFKGTEGIWSVDYDGDVIASTGRVASNTGKVVAIIGLAFPTARALADANLIATAPELLQALQLMLNAECSDTHYHAVIAAENAIAKALGEQP